MTSNTGLMTLRELPSPYWSGIRPTINLCRPGMQSESPRKLRHANSMKSRQILISFGLGITPVTYGRNDSRFLSHDVAALLLVAAPLPKLKRDGPGR
jgi:hypothetical protein